MPHVTYTTLVAAPLADVWAWHEDVTDALPQLAPPGQPFELVSAEPLPPRVGTEVIVRAKVPVLGWKRWVARYIEHEPPNDGEAWFTDWQAEGPFADWRHRHLMQAVGADTRLTDEVTYRPALGPVGKLADAILIRRQLDKMFAHRHAVTRERFLAPPGRDDGGATQMREAEG